MQILGPAPDLLNQNRCCEDSRLILLPVRAGDALAWRSRSLSGIRDHSANRAAEMTLADV